MRLRIGGSVVDAAGVPQSLLVGVDAHACALLGINRQRQNTSSESGMASPLPAALPAMRPTALETSRRPVCGGGAVGHLE